MQPAGATDEQTRFENAVSPPIAKVQGVRIGLGFRPKHRIATADIRHHRMFATVRIAHGHPMFFTRMAAIGVVRAVRKKPAEHAMFGMKHRQV